MRLRCVKESGPRRKKNGQPTRLATLQCGRVWWLTPFRAVEANTVKAAILDVESPDWLEVLNRVRHDFYHLPAYVGLCAEQDAAAGLAFYAEENGNQFLLPFLSRSIPSTLRAGECYADISSPYGYPGPVFNDSNGGSPNLAFVQSAIDAMVEMLQERKLVSAFIRLHPHLNSWTEPFARYGELVYHGDTVSVDLTCSHEELWRQTRPGHRYEIKRQQREGYRFRWADLEHELDVFIAVYEENMRRVGAASRYFFPREYYQCLREALGGRLFLAAVERDSLIACCALFVECDGIVQYHLSGTRDTHMRSSPTKLMLHEVRAWAKERGNHILHLGGGVGARPDSLFDFKAGFSPLRCQFYTWRLVLDLEAYNNLSAAIPGGTGGGKPIGTSFFPAYRTVA